MLLARIERDAEAFFMHAHVFFQKETAWLLLLSDNLPMVMLNIGS